MLTLLEALATLAVMGYFWHVCLLKWRDNVLEKLAYLDTELKRQHEMLANLVETATTFMAEEEGDLLDGVKVQLAKADAGIGAREPNEMTEHFIEEARLDDITIRLLMRSVDFPQLKIDSTMLQQRADYDIATKNIAAALVDYNDAVSDLNKGIQLFPGSLVARFTKVGMYPVFSAEEPETP